MIKCLSICQTEPVWRFVFLISRSSLEHFFCEHEKNGSATFSCFSGWPHFRRTFQIRKDQGVRSCSFRTPALGTCSGTPVSQQTKKVFLVSDNFMLLQLSPSVWFSERNVRCALALTKTYFHHPFCPPQGWELRKASEEQRRSQSSVSIFILRQILSIRVVSAWNKHLAQFLTRSANS